VGIAAARTVDPPGVSVVVPSVRSADEAVASIVAQEYEGRVECIVVDDAGRIGSEIYERVSPARVVRHVLNAGTRGAAGARNFGASLAREEVLAFCDDDDAWLPQKLALQVPRLATHVAATCGVLLETANGTFARVPPQDRVTLRDLLARRHPDMGLSTLVVTRDTFLRTVGGFDEGVPHSFGEDYDWLLRAAALGAIATVQRPLAVVRWLGGSTFQRDWHAMAEALEYILAKHPEFETSRRGKARILGQIAFAHAALRRRRAMVAAVGSALRSNPREPRIYVALAVGAGLLAPERALTLLQSRGRGI
jgi:glycosyltransferase involved in cell wall biosynthesis